MKCINSKFIKISTLLLVPILLLGCGQTTLPMSYELNHSVSSYQLNPVNIGAMESFARDLCVASEDITGDNTYDTTSLLSAGLFDLEDNEVLYASNIHEALPPASLTKVLTAIVALKNGNLGDVIIVGDEVNITESGAIVCGFEEGDQLTLSQALHGFLIKSGNDAGNVIAKHIGGSVENFIAMMNEEALAIGATNSNFMNSHGLQADNHYTTAYDMYLIFEQALEFKEFNDIISLPNYSTIYKDSNGDEKELNVNSTNLYLQETYNSPDMITVIGGKTGTTNAAGSCLMIYSKDSSGNPYISVILGASDRETLYKKMTELLATIN